ncbi:peptidoglycan-binding protein [Roseococcus sp.]|uniref:peptidoglycan-binding protein n=1 Tax=Roseococcus sp. TaxID=2109646 RepID=UPI003BA988D9
MIIAPPNLGRRVLRVARPLMIGLDVAWLQEQLGVSLADGKFGPLTASAVVAWQIEQGILGDGIVGPATWRKLGVGAPLAPAVFIPPTSTSGLVSLIERALRAVKAFDPAGWAAILAPDMQRMGIITAARIAVFLSNVTHETGGLTRLVENLTYTTPGKLMETWPSRFPDLASEKPFLRNPQALAEKVYFGRMGNVNPGDGWKFRGRALYQTTGSNNYTALGKKTGDSIEAMTNATSVLEQRPGAVRSAVIFWDSMGGNALADAGNSREARRRGNGGYIGLDDVLAREATIRRASA